MALEDFSHFLGSFTNLCPSIYTIHLEHGFTNVYPSIDGSNLLNLSKAKEKSASLVLFELNKTKRKEKAVPWLQPPIFYSKLYQNRFTKN